MWDDKSSSESARLPEHGVGQWNHHIQWSGAAARIVAVIVAVVAAATVVANPVVEESAASGQEKVTAPEYGGTLVYICDRDPIEGAWWELARQACNLVSGVLEKPGMVKWNPEGGSLVSAPFVARDQFQGVLVERWEWIDSVTLVLYVRRGVNWHDKEPVNGRELQPADLATHFDNLLGNGGGHCEDDPLCEVEVGEITHTANPTVTFHLTKPSIFGLPAILDSYQSFIFPPELIEQKGDYVGWRDLVGTGPFMLAEYLKGTSITWIRNPDYWGFDEKFPENQNQLPYVDELVAVIIREQEMRIAALRAGKAAYMGPTAGLALPLETANRLRKASSELTFWDSWVQSNHNYGVNVNSAPFHDIRVRSALQMALDLEQINDDLFGGRANWTPRGQVGDALGRYFTPFEDWPEEVKQGYQYDRGQAEGRLDEAGYPRGEDGVRFRMTINQPTSIDPAYAEAAALYWRAVGVEVDIRSVEDTEYFQMARASSLDDLSWAPAGRQYFDESMATRWETAAPFNLAAVDDPEVNQLIDTLNSARETGDLGEYQRLFREIDLYAIRQHWVIWGPEAPIVQVTQPWLEGFNGEFQLGLNNPNALFSRLWIDSELKKEMGH